MVDGGRIWPLLLLEDAAADVEGGATACVLLTCIAGVDRLDGVELYAAGVADPDAVP